jgi:hypothetical protein
VGEKVLQKFASLQLNFAWNQSISSRKISSKDYRVLLLALEELPV